MPEPVPNFRNVKKYCVNCNIQLKLNNNRDIKRKKYCSRKCLAEYHRKVGKLKCNPPKPTKESWKKAAKTRSEKMKLGLIPKPPVTIAGSNEAMKRGLKMRGKNHPRWIKDRSKIVQPRYNTSYRPLVNTWRKDIFNRDGYTCQICHEHGRQLNAHHIKSWKDYPDERYNIDNGITLCIDCHKWVHNYKGCD